MNGASGPDAVKYRCPCGAAVRALAAAAGRRARCPQCRGVFTLTLPTVGATPPSGAPASDPDDAPQSNLELLAAALSESENRGSAQRPARPTAPRAVHDGSTRSSHIVPPVRRRAAAAPPAGSGHTCPSCREHYAADVQLCIACGLDLRTGRPLLTTEAGNLESAYMYAEGVVRALSIVVWIGFAPVASEAFGLRKPWVIRTIAIVTTVLSLWYLVAFLYNPGDDPYLRDLMLWSGNWDRSDEYPGAVGQFRGHQIITSTLLHGGLGHLAGNMLFLLIFGSAVNALIGNTLTVFLYFLLGIAADLVHMAATAHEPPMPTLGASGAIMGLAGMYFVFFPVHRVHMVGWLRLTWLLPVWLKFWPIRGFWVVLTYIGIDVFYTVISAADDGVAHWAHLGGFAAGVLAGVALLLARLANARGGDILTFLFGRHAWALIGRPNRPGLTLP